jgi:hypothetical protein
VNARPRPPGGGVPVSRRPRDGKPRRQQVRLGAPDAPLAANAGLAAVSELCGRLGVTGAIDAATGPIKQRGTGDSARVSCSPGIAAAQPAGEDFLVGPDRQRPDAAGQQITPVPGLASATAAGLGQRDMLFPELARQPAIRGFGSERVLVSRDRKQLATYRVAAYDTRYDGNTP